MAEKKPPYWQMDPFEVIHHIPKQPSPTLKDLKKWFIIKNYKKNNFLGLKTLLIFLINV